MTGHRRTANSSACVQGITVMRQSHGSVVQPSRSRSSHDDNAGTFTMHHAALSHNGNSPALPCTCIRSTLDQMTFKRTQKCSPQAPGVVPCGEPCAQQYLSRVLHLRVGVCCRRLQDGAQLRRIAPAPPPRRPPARRRPQAAPAAPPSPPPAGTTSRWRPPAGARPRPAVDGGVRDPPGSDDRRAAEQAAQQRVPGVGALPRHDAVTDHLASPQWENTSRRGTTQRLYGRDNRSPDARATSSRRQHALTGQVMLRD